MDLQGLVVWDLVENEFILRFNYCLLYAHLKTLRGDSLM